MHRARHLAKHLPAASWRPIILTVDESQHEERLDPALARMLPQGLDIVKVGAWPISTTRRVGIGDIGLRAFPYLRAGLRTAVARYRPDIAFFTGGPFYPMLLARTVKNEFLMPVVLDFQDPWVSRWGEGQRLLSKSGLSHAIARKLEPIAVGSADFITSVSETQNAQLLERYPSLDKSKMAAIPIGGDPSDYDFLRAKLISQSEVRLPSEAINFTYVGTFMPRSGPVVEQLFQAVSKLKTSDPALSARLRFNFIGTSNQPNSFGGFMVRPIAEAFNVSELVFEAPQRVPYLNALSILTSRPWLRCTAAISPSSMATPRPPLRSPRRPWPRSNPENCC